MIEINLVIRSDFIETIYTKLLQQTKNLLNKGFSSYFMEGIIVNYSQGRHTQTNNQMVILFESVKSRDDALQLENKKVVWTTPSGKEMIGTITKPHGNKGAVKALFEHGLPGQAIGTKIKVL